MRNPLYRILALLFAFSLVAAACGDSDDDTEAGDDAAAESTDTEESSDDDAMEEEDDAALEGEAEEDGAMEEDDDAMEEGAHSASLVDVCPSPVIIQTDWNPEAEHGALYEMVGDDYTLDAENFIVSGPLVAGGEDTGVTIEVRTGGPAIGFQQVTAQMYQETDITFGYVSTDEAVENFADLPTKAFVAPLEINPQIIMWDPETYDVETVAELPDDTFVRYFGGATYIPFLVADGILTEDQLDDTYDGSPAVFVSEGGAIAQQGFASAEPFVYENEVPEWGKPVSFQLIHDMGFESYAAAISVRADDFETLTPCMAAITPIIQQAQVDFITNPDATNALIIEAVEAFQTGWVYTPGIADYSVQTQLDLGLVGNGPDDTLGNFDMSRVDSVVEILVSTDVFPDSAGVTAEDLVTNEFIDESIGL